MEGRMIDQMENEVLVVKGPLGDVVVEEHKVIEFEEGLIGLSELQLFVLKDLKDHKFFFDFCLLQSIENPRFALLVKPVKDDGSYYRIGELHALILSNYKVATDIETLIIVKPYRDENKKLQYSFNPKAPILIDTRSKKAKQIVIV
jgi:flagellar assembly factor FliW